MTRPNELSTNFGSTVMTIGNWLHTQAHGYRDALTVGTLVVAISSSLVQAQVNSVDADGTPQRAIAAAETPMAAEQKAQTFLNKDATSALLAVDKNRVSIIDTIVAQWRTELAPTTSPRELKVQLDEVRESLSSLRADKLLAASAARTYGGLKQVFTEADAGQKRKSLGTVANDSVYTPITPCKLIDTRGLTGTPITGGAFAASERRTYTIAGLCPGLPTTELNALMVSAATQNTGAGSGILSLMGVGVTAPVTNIFGPSAYASVTTIIDTNATGQFDAQISGVAGVALILDVVGYFAPPVTTKLECFETAAATSTTSLAIGANETLVSDRCDSGILNLFSYRAVSANCDTGNSAFLAVVDVKTELHTTGGFPSLPSTGERASCTFGNRGTGASIATRTVSAKCCRIPGR
jgi:hypothetical protein